MMKRRKQYFLLCYLVLLTLIPTINSACQDCSYIYDNSASDSSNQEIWTKDSVLQINGVFLIKGALTSGKIELTFEKKGEYEILTFEVTPGQSIAVSGKTSGGDVYKQTFSGTPSSTGDFSITFTVLPQSKYTLWYKDSSIGYERMSFNYDGNFLAFSTDKQFYTVDTVTQKTANIDALKFIYNCPSETPGICEGAGSSSRPYELLQDIVLVCRGTGIGPLSISWDMEELNAPQKVQTAISSAENQLDQVTESTIESKLTLTNFSVNDTNTFTCVVQSTLSGGLVSRLELPVEYKRNISFTGDNYFRKNQQDGKFVFYMEGWPLEKKYNYAVKLSSDAPGTISAVVTAHEEFLSAVPPRIKYDIDVLGKLNSDVLTLEITDVSQGTNLIGKYEINRVGYSCKGGYYGIETRCVLCPNNGTSSPKSDDLKNCTYSNCEVGFYGIVDDCKPCPEGKTSMEYTLEEKDCFDKDPEEVSDNRNKVLIIIFTVVGVLILLALIGALTFILYRARQRHHSVNNIVTANNAAAANNTAMVDGSSTRENAYDNHRLRGRDDDRENGERYVTLDREHYEKKRKERLNSSDVLQNG